MSASTITFAAVAAAALAGGFVGAGATLWGRRLTPLPDERPDSRRGLLFGMLGTGVAFGLLAFSYLVLRGQATDEVQPDTLWRYGRLVYQLLLLGLLAAATVTDLRDYVIPDAITVPGLVLGVGLAGLSGDLQIIHLWVDWSEAIPGLRGPGIPGWIAAHPHWHGMAWSVVGAVVGAGITWLVRSVSGLLLGQEALGFGDVTLMAMVGSFLGWQPGLVAFAAAPICGVGVALMGRWLGGRRFIPYGPSLAAGTFVTLCGWRWVWQLEIAWSPTSQFSLRRFFADPMGMAIVAGVAFAAFVVLMILLRLYRSIPTRSSSQPRGEPGRAEATADAVHSADGGTVRSPAEAAGTDAVRESDGEPSG